ncbi:amino acid adenylation domain-containing protein, partial [Variovorax sp.]|uniref:amino acid adenylation domain-containing protein n=1 Tax=Variovorax sp. TaxID=1871043 RepID=UPI001AD3744E
EVFNRTEAAYDRDKTVVELFEEQVARTPWSVAVVDEGGEVTYRELEERSNQLGHYLRERGVGVGVLVPLCVERSVEMVIGILGIIKAGGAYVPIDPTYPAERTRYMLEDIGPAVVVTTGSCRGAMAGIEGLVVVELDGEAAAIGQAPAVTLRAGAGGGDAAYVIYTSGSTGRPKGVVIEHRNVSAFLQWSRSEFSGSRIGVVYATTSICFDLSVFELFYPLVTGKRCRILDHGLVIGKYLDQDQAVLVNTVPSVIGQLLKEGMPMERIGVLNLAGEPIPWEVQEQLEVERIEVRNLYGPTEDTTYSTMDRLERGRMASIGRPLANKRVYVLNGSGALCPVGVPGELWIGGAGVSRGYLNDVERTAEKYIDNPYGEGRVYRTGDRCRWLGDGTIEYLGRLDQQVKVRGYRIEPGEIEAVLECCPGVSRAVVVVKEGPEGQKRLVAYVSMSGGYERQAVWQWLRSRLPEYMVPSQLVELEELPLTANGKVDRRRLPDPGQAESGGGYEAPRTETERVLAGIWSGLLGRERIGINDNFFEIGGDSIISIQVVSRARRQGYELQPRDLFLYQTIGKLSAVLSSRGSGVSRGEQGLLTGRCGLLPVQAWYLGREREGLSHFNQSILLEVDKGVGGERLREVWSALVRQHDVLRFVYRRGGEGWEQRYGEGPGLLLEEDLRMVGLSELGERITACCQVYQRGLDIEAGRVSCGVWLRTPEGEACDRLLVVVHHLAVDGVSWRIMVEDLERLLRGEELGLKTGSYREWYGALEGYSQSRRLSGQVGYWQEVCEGSPGLPVDREDTGEVRQGDLDHYSGELPVEATRQLLQEAGRAYRTEINDVLLSVLSGVLCGWSGGKEVVIGLEGHGREEIGQAVDTSRTVGWFTTMYPVRLPGGAGKSGGERLRAVKEALRRVPDKGLGYGVLRYMKGEAGLQGVEWELVFNYLGQLDQVVEGRGEGLLRGAKEWTGESSSEDQPVGEKLLVGAAVQGGRLVVRWSYSRRHYRKETIAALVGKYLRALEELIDHCVEQGRMGKVVSSPSDYGLGEVMSCAELDGFVADQGDREVESMSRLSGLQEGMLFHGLYDGEAGAYIEQFGCRMRELRVEVFVRSWEHLMRRHSILRSGFWPEAFGVPVQVVYGKVRLPVEEVDLRGLSAEEQVKAIEDYERRDRQRGFDFGQAPLMRIGLLRTGEETYWMVWTHHHMLLDGWSLQLLLGELLETY